MSVYRDADGKEQQELTARLSRYFCPCYFSPVQTLVSQCSQFDPCLTWLQPQSLEGMIRRRWMEFGSEFLGKRNSSLSTTHEAFPTLETVSTDI